MSNVSKDQANAAKRFWPKVDKTPACWLWTASRNLKGYGMFHYNGRPMLAHRFAYELLVAPIADGLQLDHLCRVRNCVNPAHLEPVTNRENTLRGAGATAVNATKTHCLNGHPFTPENTINKAPTKDQPNGGRGCRTCRQERDRARHARQQQGKAAP